MNKIEIWSCKLVIYFLKKGYGPKCRTLDLEDIQEIEYDTQGRCPTCKAHEIINWLESHIDLINE